MENGSGLATTLNLELWGSINRKEFSREVSTKDIMRESSLPPVFLISAFSG